MSERKTTEIKLRVTPDEKALWQTEAEQQGVALSELIRQSLNSLCAEQNLRFDGMSLINNAIKNLADAPPQDGVPTSDGADLVAGEWQPWMYEARRSG